MGNLFHIYTDLLGNIINVILLFRFADNSFPHKVRHSYKLFLLVAYTLYSLPEYIPYAFVIGFCLDAFFLLVSSWPNWKTSFFILLKYEVYGYLSRIVILLLHSLVFNDFSILSVSDIYEEYKLIIISFLAYVFYVLYTNYRQNRRISSRYSLYFSMMIGAICLLLSYSTLYICRKEPDSQMLPLLFTILIILIILCISLYDKFLALVVENADYKIQAEINRLQENYALQIEENLNTLRSLRHDIKNHLIIIDGYASQKNYEKIHEYIQNIGTRFKDTSAIQTPSVPLSAILNEKASLAKQENILYEITCNIPYLKINDFTMITIVGNLLDNAICAASKCEAGWLRAAIQQKESALSISVDNSHTENIQERDGVFTSTKADKSDLHGIGIKNVRKAVNDLRGQIEITYTENTFHVGILLPNYK